MTAAMCPCHVSFICPLLAEKNMKSNEVKIHKIMCNKNKYMQVINH